MNKKLRPVLILLFASVFLFSGWKLTQALLSYRESADTYTTLEQYISFDTTPLPPATQPDDTASPTQPRPDVSRWPVVDFEALSEINPDIVAWIHIADTNISYPVVQGQDNDHYLHYLFDGTKNKAGSIFLDHRSDPHFRDRHTVIYGHHVKDKTMFSRLMRYKKQSFYDEHTDILLVTPDAYYSLRVFSGYVADSHTNAWDLDMTEQEHEQWLSQIREKSCFQTDYAPPPGAPIITLSTCTYEFDNAKFVLHAYIEQVIEKE